MTERNIFIVWLAIDVKKAPPFRTELYNAVGIEMIHWREDVVSLK